MAKANSIGVRDRKKSQNLLIMLIPAILLFIIFRYIPLGFLSIVFKDYNIFAGFADSEWVGLKHFQTMFSSPEFLRIFRNTILISLYKILFVFTIPVLFAILLNEIGIAWFKKTVQTLVFLPNFLAWTAMYSVFFSIFNGEGIINQILTALGQDKIFFFVDKGVFRGLLVATDVWKTTGWRIILYMAVMSSFDQQLYEAAIIDGANRIHRMLRITFPLLIPAIFTFLLLYISYVIPSSFEQILIMYNPQVYEVADILTTNVYREGLGQLKLSYGAAVGLFNSVMVFLLAIFTNRMSRRFSERPIW